jgi:response regulator RpfG family c-di-GMP phosphodiesterase
MKLIRKTVSETPSSTLASSLRSSRQAPWKILVVDDEPDIHILTRLNLRDFTFAQRPLEILSANSAAEAKQILAEHDDIAVALVDVVMETDDAGLLLVRHIRDEMKNVLIRLIIRTGQPGVAPERFVIDNFDIDDYKDKTELTVQKLYTSVRSALKSYRDLNAIELNRIGLESILGATPDLFKMRSETLQDFFRGVLTQIIALCNLGESGLITTVDGFVSTFEENEIRVQAGTGDLSQTGGNARLRDVLKMCSEAVRSNLVPQGLRQESIVVPLLANNQPLGFIYLESEQPISELDRKLILIFANQCAAALENLRLHINLEESYEHAIDMLAMVAEYKDSTTGAHIARIADYSRLLALELGMAQEVADKIGMASRLHDVGKVAIPDSLLRKPGPLNEEEFEHVKKHAEIGAAILGGDPAMALARDIALHHHERYSGGGYPSGVRAEELPLSSRIVTVVDVFDALVSRRPYKEAWSVVNAFAELRQEAGGRYDPRAVAALEQLHQRGALDEILRRCALDVGTE